MTTHPDDYDLTEMHQLVNDGQSITAEAVLIDLVGGVSRIYFSQRRGGTPVLTPSHTTEVSALEWMEQFGRFDLQADAEEAMAEQRDVLKDLDVSGGKLIAFVYRAGRS